MRAVRVGDLDEALRVLLAQPEGDWPQLVREMLDRAHAADKLRKRTGRSHPQWGTGSLMSQARSRQQAAYPLRHDSNALAALVALATAILRWRSDRASL
jgi:hypothetical protein